MATADAAMASLARCLVPADVAGEQNLAAEIGDDSPIFTVSNSFTDFKQVLRQPNAVDGDIDNIIGLINGPTGWSPLIGNPFGTAVPPGCLSFAESCGRVYAAGPGRIMLKPSYKFLGYASWLGTGGPVNVAAKNELSIQGLTICRVGPAQIGLALEHGTQPVLLAPGLHVYNTPTFSFSRSVEVQSSYFQHGSYHVVRVQRGRFALVWESPTQPRILREGSYVIKSPTFKFDKFTDISLTYIKHGTIHIIQVPKGQVGKVTENVTPKLLAEGMHMVDHPNFEFSGLEQLASPLIKHGTITRFRVNMGQIGLATWCNEAVFIDVPGTYEVDSPDFMFHSVADTTTRLLLNGNKKVVTVYSGEVGLSYKGGELDVLEPGRHVIAAADHFFDSFLSTQQVTLRLEHSETQGASRGAPVRKDLILAETKDFVKVGICADIFYRIADARKAIISVGKDGVEELVTETAIGTLTNIIRSSNITEIAQSKNASAQSTEQAEKEAREAQALGKPAAPLFFDRAHDEFLARLHDDFLARYGIDISNIRIESCKIMDEELSVSISRQAIMTAQTENQLANLKGQTEIATAEQERQARVAQIVAEQEARAMQTTTDSQNRAQLDRAEADAKARAIAVNQQAEALIAQAKAEAESVTLRAQAEADAIRTKAKAEAERAELLAKTPLGAQLALLDVWSGTVQKSNEGISKVVYCDPSVQLAAGGGNPLSLLGLGTLQKELEKLASVGKESAPAAGGRA